MFGLTPFNRNAVRRADDQDLFSNLIDDFFSDGFFPMRSLRYDTFKIDVEEQNDAFIVEADLPGVKKEDIHLNIEDGYLTIEIKTSEEKSEEKKHYVHKERRQCAMRRSIHLGDLDIEAIDAELKDGILTIKAPKSAVIENKKRIEIK
ncbi:MAG: Hsp20/alpha crystallin family protein [Acholeplasmataceae bacterium]